MTKISDIRDAIISTVSAALTGYNRLPNAYIITENNELYLNKGYSVGAGAGVSAVLEIPGSCGNLGYRRNFSVAIVNRITATNHDLNARDDIENQILEDFKSIRDALESNVTLGGSAIKIDYIGDTGLQFAEGDRTKFLSIQVDYEVLYQDSYV